MGRLAERLNALTIRATSPDRRIQGILTRGTHIDLSFVDADAYNEYDSESSMSIQLSAVVTDLLRGRRSGHRSAIAESAHLTLTDGPHWDARVRRFQTERDSTTVEGISDRESTTIRSTGMHDAHVSIKPGTLGRYSEREFLTEVRAAINDLWADWAMVKQQLRSEYLGARSGGS